MKIDIVNINVLALKLLQNMHLESTSAIGQQQSSQSSFSGESKNQLYQLLTLMNLFPLFSRISAKSSDPVSPLSVFLKNIVMPEHPKLAAQWLADRHADKSLFDAIKLASQSVEVESSGKLKAMLMLLAEQRVHESNKNGEYTWLFPFSNQQPTPVNVTVKKKPSKNKKKSRWSVTVNLTLSKNRQMVATADIEDDELSLTFATNSKELQNRVEGALPLLEKQLANHQIHIAKIEIESINNPTEVTLSRGMNIQV